MPKIPDAGCMFNVFFNPLSLHLRLSKLSTVYKDVFCTLMQSIKTYIAMWLTTHDESRSDV